ncbi:hypothetical protein ACHAWF_008726, partial [Thalassiosira exigua]
MVFDPSEPDIDMADFPREDWSYSIYGDAKEELPRDMPEPRGRGFRIVTYVDCDLGGDCVTRRSRTGFAVFLNGAPLYWMSK